MPLLQAARSCASLLFNLNLFMSSCTHSCQVFLPPLPLPLTPSTTKLLHADTRSVGSLRSTCPYHLSLPRLTTSEIPSMPKRLNNSSLLFLSRSVTPHINLTIILSVRSSLCISSTFIAHVSLPYIKTLCTQAL